MMDMSGCPARTGFRTPCPVVSAMRVASASRSRSRGARSSTSRLSAWGSTRVSARASPDDLRRTPRRGRDDRGDGQHDTRRRSPWPTTRVMRRPMYSRSDRRRLAGAVAAETALSWATPACSRVTQRRAARGGRGSPPPRRAHAGRPRGRQTTARSRRRWSTVPHDPRSRYGWGLQHRPRRESRRQRRSIGASRPGTPYGGLVRWSAPHASLAAGSRSGLRP